MPLAIWNRIQTVKLHKDHFIYATGSPYVGLSYRVRVTIADLVTSWAWEVAGGVLSDVSSSGTAASISARVLVRPPMVYPPEATDALMYLALQAAAIAQPFPATQQCQTRSHQTVVVFPSAVSVEQRVFTGAIKWPFFTIAVAWHISSIAVPSDVIVREFAIKFNNVSVLLTIREFVAKLVQGQDIPSHVTHNFINREFF